VAQPGTDGTGDRGTLCRGCSRSGAPVTQRGSGRRGQRELGEKPSQTLSPGNAALRSLQRSETAKNLAPGTGVPTAPGSGQRRGSRGDGDTSVPAPAPRGVRVGFRVRHVSSGTQRHPRPPPVPCAGCPRGDGWQRRSHHCLPGPRRRGRRAPKHGPRDVQRRRTRSDRHEGPHGRASPSTRRGCSGGRGLSPPAPPGAALMQDRREATEISMDSLPRVPRGESEGKNPPNDFKRTLQGVLEDSEIFKAKRVPAKTEHVCARGHTAPHAEHPRSRPRRGRGTQGPGSREVSDCSAGSPRHLRSQPCPDASARLRAHANPLPWQNPARRLQRLTRCPGRQQI